MAELEFIDTHVHFFDFNHPDLQWVWLEPDFVHPQLGDIDGIKARAYRLDHFIAESRHTNVPKAVHVQAAIGSADPVKETAWLQEAADQSDYPLAIVAYSNLKDPTVEEELERHCAHPSTRGIRDFSEGDYLVDPEFHRGYALLEKFNLVCDLDSLWEDMGKARDLARKFPNIVMVLDHAGFPQERTDEYFENWKRGVTTLAEAENVVCKVSGLGMKDPEWTVDGLRPWVLHCIESFGVQRCMFGSNWPVDRLFSSYPDVINAYVEIIGDFNHDEQVELFSGNAERYYRF